MRFLKFLSGFVLFFVSLALGFAFLFNTSGARWVFGVAAFISLVGGIYLVRHN